eukprot:GHVQ01000752.1.p2 GENE.GHVQ01000752.1~~GHVQ01000752.1.p2  ORF type:complete len:104 (+),score=19.15 GHVQ01000752.1:442-753(+)
MISTDLHTHTRTHTHAHSVDLIIPTQQHNTPQLYYTYMLVYLSDYHHYQYLHSQHTLPQPLLSLQRRPVGGVVLVSIYVTDNLHKQTPLTTTNTHTLTTIIFA